MSIPRFNISPGIAATVVASLLLACGGAQIALAQTPVDVSEKSVDDLRRHLYELQSEVDLLRQRDAERQEWESSIIKRLPSANMDFVSHGGGSSFECDAGAPGCDCPQAPACGCSPGPACDGSCGACDCCCGCYPCLCPLQQAPCICCPHVSTVQPYYNIRIFGALKTDVLFNEARPIAPGTPFFLVPGPVAGFDQHTFDIHARQSTLGAALTGPQMGNFRAGGMFTALFYNDNVLADKYGLLPLLAWADLSNENWRFAAGLQFDVFAPGLPTILPFSALGASGNAGNSFRGQLRAERFLNPYDDVQWTLQLALSEPIVTSIDPTFGLSEDNGWPNVEGRVALGLGMPQGPTAQRPFEFGVSGVVGQMRNTVPLVTQVVADVWGLSADVRWKANDVFGFQGEVFTGQGLGTYNAGILQNVNGTTFQAIRASGGWAEMFVYWTPCLHSHIGYGIDDPINRDVDIDPLLLGRTKNSTAYANLLWDLNQSLRIGFELTWRETDYRVLPDNDGAGFHTQFQWAF